jgi:hypothetical protein
LVFYGIMTMATLFYETIYSMQIWIESWSFVYFRGCLPTWRWWNKVGTGHSPRAQRRNHIRSCH